MAKVSCFRAVAECRLRDYEPNENIRKVPEIKYACSEIKTIRINGWPFRKEA
jgi:hypothetical protein